MEEDEEEMAEGVLGIGGMLALGEICEWRFGAIATIEVDSRRTDRWLRLGGWRCGASDRENGDCGDREDNVTLRRRSCLTATVDTCQD